MKTIKVPVDEVGYILEIFKVQPSNLETLENHRQYFEEKYSSEVILSGTAIYRHNNDYQTISVLIDNSYLTIAKQQSNDLIPIFRSIPISHISDFQFEIKKIDLFLNEPEVLQFSYLANDVTVSLYFMQANCVFQDVITKFKEIYEMGSTIVSDARDNSPKTRIGPVLVWDYDHIKLKKHEIWGDDTTAVQIGVSLRKFLPIQIGLCLSALEVTDNEIKKIRKISPSIQVLRENIDEDRVDYVLIGLLKNLLAKRNPSAVILIGNDHIYSSLIEELRKNNVETFLIYNGKKPSKRLIESVPEKYRIPINYDIEECSFCGWKYYDHMKELNHFCAGQIEFSRMLHEKEDEQELLVSSESITCRYCNNEISKASLTEHLELEHKRSIQCIIKGCTSKFRSMDDMNKHISDVHNVQFSQLD